MPGVEEKQLLYLRPEVLRMLCSDAGTSAAARCLVRFQSATLVTAATAIVYARSILRGFEGLRGKGLEGTGACCGEGHHGLLLTNIF